MPKIIYVSLTGEKRTADCPVGCSVMETALVNGIEEIEAQCGGSCNCGTCHCYVDPAWVDRLAPKSEWESELVASQPLVRENSRLSCQIIMREDLDGLVVHLPEYQGVR